MRVFSFQKVGLWFLLISIVFNFNVFAAGENPMIFLFMMKQIFPDAKEVTFFMSEEQVAKLKHGITAASAQMQLKAQICPIKTSMDIGGFVKGVSNESNLIVFSSDVLEKNSAKLYILKKCKEKKINIFTSIPSYSESGALFGIIMGGGARDIILNLKHSGHLVSHFTPELRETLKVTKVIE